MNTSISLHSTMLFIVTIKVFLLNNEYLQWIPTIYRLEVFHDKNIKILLMNNEWLYYNDTRYSWYKKLFISEE